MKRLIDLTIAILGLITLSPIFLALCIAIRMKMGAPIFFRQVRPGLHGEPFVIIKFRSMKSINETQGMELSDEIRMTRLGRFLRASSLDELPELWNVVKGEMSLVGPRPLLVEYLPLYSPEQARRHEVRPGLTGWAQINGRNAISWEQKFQLDLWYIDNRSLLLDVKILWLTLVKVVRREGISAAGGGCMPPFKGNGK